MSVPQIFYNVPNVPGVPPMLRAAGSTISNVQGVVAGIQNTIQFFQGAQPLPPWGIFDADFNSVLDADSIAGFTNRKESNLLDFPVQDGGFASYNKVQVPSSSSVRIRKGGTLSDRANLIRQLDALQASMDLFSIVTPEKTYISVNCERYELTRQDVDDAFFLNHVELFFKEIRVVQATFTTTAVGADTSNAQNPAAQTPTNQGVQQPATPTPTIQNAATTALAGGA